MYWFASVKGTVDRGAGILTGTRQCSLDKWRLHCEVFVWNDNFFPVLFKD